MIPRVEILKMASKMASKMAASNVLKTYLTNKLDKKHLILPLFWLFRGLMIQAIKTGLVQKVEIFKMVSKMVAILKQNST